MNINVDPSLFQKNESLSRVSPEVNTYGGLQSIQKRETEVSIKGDIFTYSGVNFTPMTQEDLINEKIEFLMFLKSNLLFALSFYLFQ